MEKNPEFQVKAIFSNGQEALNYIWLNPVDLIVLDLFMPKMNGKEFLYRLRKENFQVDVIVVTAASDAGNIREVLPFGVVDYLLKPFEAARFAEALERFEQRHRILNAMSGLDQKGIDAVFSTPGGGGGRFPPGPAGAQGPAGREVPGAAGLSGRAGRKRPFRRGPGGPGRGCPG